MFIGGETLPKSANLYEPPSCRWPEKMNAPEDGQARHPTMNQHEVGAHVGKQVEIETADPAVAVPPSPGTPEPKFGCHCVAARVCTAKVMPCIR